MDFSQLKREAPVLYKPCVTSTNTILKALASTKKLPDGFVLIAEKQSSGRGRLGRSFESPEGGLYMSALFYPNCALEEFATLTPCTAIAVSRAVERVCGIKAEIKWPNDLQIDGKKLCGILTESASFCGRRYVVVGMGINVNTRKDALAPELREIAVSLAQFSGSKVDIQELASAIVKELDGVYKSWCADRKCFLEEYRKRCSSLGCDVSLIRGDEIQWGRSLDIDENYALVVKVNGVEEHVAFGEISVRKKTD